MQTKQTQQGGLLEGVCFVCGACRCWCALPAWRHVGQAWSPGWERGGRLVCSSRRASGCPCFAVNAWMVFAFVNEEELLLCLLFELRKTWVQIPVVPLTSWVSLSNSLNLGYPYNLSSKWRRFREWRGKLLLMILGEHHKSRCSPISIWGKGEHRSPRFPQACLHTVKRTRGC